MGFAASQNFRYGKSDFVGVKLQYLVTAQTIHSSTHFRTLRVPRNVHSDKRDSFLHECCFLAAIMRVNGFL